MKFFVALFVCAFAASALGEEVDQVLANENLLKVYFDCLVDKGECPADGKKLKEKIPEALENGCEKCSEEEKTEIKKVVEFLIKEKPDLWEELANKYDPDNKYREKYADKLAG